MLLLKVIPKDTDTDIPTEEADPTPVLVLSVRMFFAGGPCEDLDLVSGLRWLVTFIFPDVMALLAPLTEVRAHGALENRKIIILRDQFQNKFVFSSARAHLAVLCVCVLPCVSLFALA